MAGLTLVLSAEPFPCGVLGAAQPHRSLGIGCLPAEGLHFILFSSWVQVLERVSGMPDPAWNWAPAGPYCEFRLMSTLLLARCLAWLAVGRAAGLAWICGCLSEIHTQSRATLPRGAEGSWCMSGMVQAERLKLIRTCGCGGTCGARTWLPSMQGFVWLDAGSQPMQL